MVVTPYKLRPERPTVGYLTPDGVAIDEHGERVRLGRVPATHRLWCSFDTARSLISEGNGEALCWNGEEIRWRPRSESDVWRASPSDVCVIRLPLEELHRSDVLRGLARWRDWLHGHGAIASGTMGTASWSLLRATLERPLFTPGEKSLRPPLRFTLGGRQELGAGGPGRYEGPIEHLDLQAAYARTLGSLEYGGRWLDSSALGCDDAERLAATGRPVFVRARVRIPDGLEYGPLPERPTSATHPFLLLGLGPEYPTGVTMQRVWTWQEVEAAREAGCRVRVLELWAHFAGGRRPFARWLEAVEQGRGMHGLAGTLAKMTGNALWGRFAMRSDGSGRRVIRARYGRHTASRDAPRAQGGIPAAHDLAETVSGRVRAQVFRAMLTLGPDLLSVHTDGGWRLNRDGDEPPAGGWRVKARAGRLDVLSPQSLRYTTLEGRTEVVLSGTPSAYAPERFAELWADARMAP